MVKFVYFVVLILISLMTGQQTNAQQQQQQQQVPAKIAGDSSPTLQQQQQQQQQQLAKVALEKQEPAVPEAKSIPAMESAYEVPAVAGKIAGDTKEADDKGVIVISEKTLSEHQAAAAAAAAGAVVAHPPQVVAQQQQEQKPPTPTKADETKPKKDSKEQTDSKSQDDNKQSDESNKLPHEAEDESFEKQNSQIMKIKNKPLGIYPDMDIDDDSYKTASLFFLGISSFAVLFIAYKIYRMRLTRAERKYGVQGNRAAQELTPLPMSVDDVHGNSDDEDHTLFDRHQVRIL